MLRTILAFFGYIKVPQEAVQMSMLFENDFKALATVLGRKDRALKADFEHRHKAMQTLTQFLRSGRLLT